MCRPGGSPVANRSVAPGWFGNPGEDCRKSLGTAAFSGELPNRRGPVWPGRESSSQPAAPSIETRAMRGHEVGKEAAPALPGSGFV